MSAQRSREERLLSRPATDGSPATPAADPAEAAFDANNAAWHKEVKRAFDDLPVPPDLAERIVAARGAEGRRRAYGGPWVWLAAAASIVLVARLLLGWGPGGELVDYAGFKQRLAGFAARQYRMDLETGSLAEVREFLRRAGRPSDFQLPASLAGLPVKGGASLSWQQRPVSMVCLGLGEGQTLYLFMMVRGTEPGFAEIPRGGEAFGRLSTLAWSEGDLLYLAVAERPAGELELLVAPRESVRQVKVDRLRWAAGRRCWFGA
jgi:hypothetical protein